MALIDTAKLLCHFNGNDGEKFSDDTTERHTLTFAGDSQIDTDYRVFGVSSAYIHTNGIAIENNRSDFYFGTNDFTIDFRIRFANLNYTGLTTVLCQGLGWALYIPVAGYFRLWNSGYGPNFDIPWTVSLNTWYNIRFVRHDLYFKLFVNGIQQGSTQYSTASLSAYNSVLSIGIDASGQSARIMNGWIDELLIVNGEALSFDNYSIPTSEFDITLTVTKDLEIPYIIRGVVNKNLELEYNIGNVIDKDLEFIYDIHSRVYKDLPMLYSIREGIRKDCEFVYNVGSLLHKDLEFNYNLYKNIYRDLGFLYNIGTTVSKDLEFIYNLIAPIYKDLEFDYNIGSIVNKDLEFQYDLVSAVGKSLNVTYNIRSKVFRQIRTIYDILSLIAKNLELQYGIRTVVSKDSILLYNIFNTCSKSLENQYNIYNSIGQSCVLEYNIISQILASIYRDLILKYNIPKKDIVVNLIIPDKIKINIRLD